MKILPLLAFLAAAASASAQIVQDVTAPGDQIQPITEFGDPGTSPGNEQVPLAIDDSIATKYLNFAAGNGTATGFIVTPAFGTAEGGTILTGARFAAANDAPERDPITFTLEGSNDGGTTFLPVFSGQMSTNLETDPGRNTFDDPVFFANSAFFTTYRLLFPTLRGQANGCCMQIAEVELLGRAVPEPTSLGLLALGGVMFASRRRRQVG